MRRRTAFTLIELLVVVAIIALLVAILVPAVNRARDIAKRVICTTQFKQTATAAYMYSNDYNGYTPRLGFIHFPGLARWSIPDDDIRKLEAYGPAALVPYMSGGEGLMQLPKIPFGSGGATNGYVPVPNNSVWEMFLCPTWATSVEPAVKSEYYSMWSYGQWTNQWVIYTWTAQFCGTKDNNNPGSSSRVNARGTSEKLVDLPGQFPMYSSTGWILNMNWNSVIYVHNFWGGKFEGVNVARADGSAGWVEAGNDPSQVFEVYYGSNGRYHMYPSDY